MISVHPSEYLRRRKQKRTRKHGNGELVMVQQIVCGVGARRATLFQVDSTDEQAMTRIARTTPEITPMTTTTIRVILVEEPLITLGLD
jgi:hypothetical protein